MNKPQVTGHLWNNWLGMASDVTRCLYGYKDRPTPEKSRGISLFSLKELCLEKASKLISRDKLSEDEKAKLQQLEALEIEAELFLAEFKLVIIDFVALDSDSRESYPDGPFFKMLLVPEHKEEEVIRCLKNLKSVCIKVNELLCGKPCEFFKQ